MHTAHATLPTQPPIERSTRRTSIDAARALALLGMFVVHAVSIWSFDADGWAADIEHHLAGRAMPLFVVLAGVGLDMLLAGVERPWQTMLGRSAVLLVVGLWLSGHTAVAVIIPCYAVYLLMGTALRRMSDAGLLVAAATIMVVGSVLRFHVGHFPTPAWPAPGPQVLGQLGSVTHPLGLISELTVTGLYPALPAASLMVVGMWVSRRIRRCTTGESRVRFAVRLTIVGLSLVAGTTMAAGFTSAGRQTALMQQALWSELEPGMTVDDMLEEQAAAVGMTVDEMLEEESEVTGTPIDELRAMADVEPAQRTLWPWLILATEAHNELPGWLLSSAGSSLAVIGIFLAADERRRARRVLATVAPLGRASLSAYALHIGVIWMLFRLHPDGTEPSSALLIAMAVWVVLVGLAATWERHLGRAPLERLMRAAGRRSASAFT